MFHRYCASFFHSTRRRFSRLLVLPASTLNIGAPPNIWQLFGKRPRSDTAGHSETKIDLNLQCGAKVFESQGVFEAKRADNRRKLVAGTGFEPVIPQSRDYEPDELPGCSF
jgi:hypothetical protein